MHLDGTKPHVHIVFKDRNRITGKKIDMDRADILFARQTFCNEMEKYGIKNSATLRRDRVSYQDLMDGKKCLNNNKGRLAVILEQETQEIVDKDGKKKKVKIPPADILTKVRYHGAITRFEKQVNENLNGLFSPVRKNELMKEVKALKKELRKLPRDKFEQMLSKTIENLGKSGKELQQSVEQIKAMPKNQRLIADINRWKAIESLADKQTKDIETVLREIEHIPTDARTKKETKTAMKVLQKNVKNIKRDISKGKSK